MCETRTATYRWSRFFFSCGGRRFKDHAASLKGQHHFRPPPMGVCHRGRSIFGIQLGEIDKLAPPYSFFGGKGHDTPERGARAHGRDRQRYLGPSYSYPTTSCKTTTTITNTITTPGANRSVPPPPLTQLGPSASVQRSPVNAIKGPTGTGGGRAADNDSPPHPAWRPCSTSDAGDVVVIS